MANVDIPAPLQAYAGNEPYLFVSYAHHDSKLVYPDIRYLHECGYRTWYDEGIAPGNEWPEEVARALVGCSYFIVFVSPHAVESRNVRNEINFALARKKAFLAVHITNTVLPAGLELQMGSIQAIMRFRMSETVYREKLIKTVPISIRGIMQIPEPTPNRQDLRPGYRYEIIKEASDTEYRRTAPERKRCDECKYWEYESSNVWGIADGHCPFYADRHACDEACADFQLPPIQRK